MAGGDAFGSGTGLFGPRTTTSEWDTNFLLGSFHNNPNAGHTVDMSFGTPSSVMMSSAFVSSNSAATQSSLAHQAHASSSLSAGPPGLFFSPAPATSALKQGPPGLHAKPHGASSSVPPPPPGLAPTFRSNETAGSEASTSARGSFLSYLSSTDNDKLQRSSWKT